MNNPLPSGFTLLEMLVVLVIIGLVAGFVGPGLFGHVEGAKVDTAGTQVKMLKSSLSAMYLDLGRYPTDQEGLSLLNTSPADENTKSLWKGPYLEESVPLDPWNRPYQYSAQTSNSGQPFSLYSLGADGQPGGIGNNADVGYVPSSR